MARVSAFGQPPKTHPVGLWGGVALVGQPYPIGLPPWAVLPHWAALPQIGGPVWFETVRHGLGGVSADRAGANGGSVVGAVQRIVSGTVKR